jgi:hypothetical protein
MLKLHAFEHTVNLVLIELQLEELSDAFEHLGLELLAGSSKLVMVILVEPHGIPLENPMMVSLWR